MLDIVSKSCGYTGWISYRIFRFRSDTISDCFLYTLDIVSNVSIALSISGVERGGDNDGAPRAERA